MAHRAPPKRRRWTGQSARRRPPAPAPGSCGRTSVCPSFQVVAHAVLSMVGAHSRWSPFLPIDPADIHIYKKLAPSYGRNTTPTTILSQPNTIILLTPFLSHLCQSDDVVEPIIVGCHTYSLCITPHSFCCSSSTSSRSIHQLEVPKCQSHTHALQIAKWSGW
jgi:hypothetical protein